jgi:hypothetical protein
MLKQKIYQRLKMEWPQAANGRLEARQRNNKGFFTFSDCIRMMQLFHFGALPIWGEIVREVRSLINFLKSPLRVSLTGAFSWVFLVVLTLS